MTVSLKVLLKDGWTELSTGDQKVSVMVTMKVLLTDALMVEIYWPTKVDLTVLMKAKLKDLVRDVSTEIEKDLKMGLYL